MVRRFTRRLVIDSSVLQAAGERSKDLTSQRCRTFLQEVRRICHRVVITPEIKEHWKNHLSNFSSKWLRAMAQRGRQKTFHINIGTDSDLRKTLRNSVKTDRAQRKILADALLVETALKTDNIIVSCDDKARILFKHASQKVAKLKKIVWVNPSITEERAINWLQRGAKPEQNKLLKPASTS